MAGAGAQAEDLAVAHHAGHEERAEIERRERRDIGVGFGGVEILEHQSEQDGEERQPEAAVIPARAVEADDEGKQVEAERQDPQERHHGDVLTELVGDREQQHHAAGGQGEPEELAKHRGRGLGVVGRGLGRVGSAATPDFDATPGGEAGVDHEPDRPPLGLGLTGELRFEHEGVGQ